MDWMEDAACSGRPTEWWFPDMRGGYALEEDLRLRLAEDSYLRFALETCQACPVKQECLRWGRDEPHGIFGGLLPFQRNGMTLGVPPSRRASRQRDCSETGRQRCLWKEKSSRQPCATCQGVARRREERARRNRRIEELAQQGVTPHDIAEEVGLTVGAVRKRIAKGRDHG